MNSKNMVWIVIGLVIAVVVGWNLFKPAGGGIVNVDAAGAQEAISRGAQIVDVRSPGEFQLGHIPGAINVPIEQFEGQATGWDRDGEYLVYCATGARSQSAIDIMSRTGFANVKHFNAGLVAWPGELQKGEAAPAQKIETSGLPVMIEFYTDS
jgi:rhodanese-related sulfurtransferase